MKSNVGRKYKQLQKTDWKEVISKEKRTTKDSRVSDVHVYLKSDAVIWSGQYCHVTRQACDNFNCRPQMCSANKVTGKMVSVQLREEWISLFGHGTYQRYIFTLSTRFVRTSGNGGSHKTWSHFLFAQHLEAYLLLRLWWTCSRYNYFS